MVFSDDGAIGVASDDDGAIVFISDDMIETIADEASDTAELAADDASETAELIADETGAASDEDEATGAADEDETTTAELELTATGVVGVGVPRLKIQMRPMITITATMMIIQVLRFMGCALGWRRIDLLLGLSLVLDAAPLPSGG
jgi:hypothetical protein